LSDTKVIEFKIPGDTKSLTYKMEFDFNALVRAENLTGLNLMALSQGMSAGQTRAHVFAAMAKHHPEASIEDAGMLLTAGKEAVLDALERLYDGAAADPGGIQE
jgi:hypothetical protein